MALGLTEEKSSRWILHADMDAFYASVEQRDNPKLFGLPVIVGATSRRGVVAAASYEARRFGITSAMPAYRAHQLCPEGVFLRPRMRRYAEVSARVREVFETFTPVVEPLALDEAFLDITGSLKLLGAPLDLGRELKARVSRATGLKVSVGIAPSKLVAKIACTFSKPDGLLVVPPEAVAPFLEQLPIRRLWGVGPVLAERLGQLGVERIGQLRRIDPVVLRGVAGNQAERLQRLAIGEDPRAVVRGRAPKSCGEENTFERDVSDFATISSALTAHSEAVAERLRKLGLEGRTVTLKIKLARRVGARVSRLGGEGAEPRYPLLTRSQTLPNATSDGARIRAVALSLWHATRLTEPVRLLGVSVSGLQQKELQQLSLFEPPPEPDRLGPTLDAIRRRFGADAIGRAVARPEKLTPSTKTKSGR